MDVSTGTLYYYSNNYLGTPLLLTDDTGKVVWDTDYKPFGEATVNSNSTVVNNFRFAGQYYDSETGLHYNYHRYYDPKTGRYLTPDPIGLAGGINLYVYGDGNPIRYTDMLGLTRDDVYAAYQHIIENVRGINPSKGWFYPILPLVAFDSDLPDASGDAYTERFWGRPVLPSDYLCNLSEEQFIAMYASLLHEMIHSTDSISQRKRDAKYKKNPNHRSIGRRVEWEMGMIVSGTIVSGTSSDDAVIKVDPIWGLPQQYVGGDLVNSNNILPKIKDLYKRTR